MGRIGSEDWTCIIACCTGAGFAPRNFSSEYSLISRPYLYGRSADYDIVEFSLSYIWWSQATRTISNLYSSASAKGFLGRE